MFEQIKNRDPQCINVKKYSAVLIPLMMIDDQYHILFEIRSRSLQKQPGEVCFPGGRMDPNDKDTLETAIRETKEELLIQEKNIHIYGPLDYYVSPNGMRVDAYLAELSNYSYTFNEEVEDVFTVPLSFFLENQPNIYTNTTQTIPDPALPFDRIPDQENYHWVNGQYDVPFYFYEDKVIWGLTARLLYHNLKHIE